MSNSKPARGRPKGTGRDDRAILMSVTKLLQSNPHLKPTTAIKSVGVTDPSAIRRLRDKFHAVNEPAPSRPAAKRAKEAVQPVQAPRAVALKATHEPVRSQIIQSKPAALSAGPVAPSWFTLWAELGLQTMAASFQAQLIMYDHVLSSPPMKAALGSQAALTGFAALWCATSPNPGKTLH